MMMLLLLLNIFNISALVVVMCFSNLHLSQSRLSPLGCSVLCSDNTQLCPVRIMLQHSFLSANHFPSFLCFSLISQHFIFENNYAFENYYYYCYYFFIFPPVFSFHNLKLCFVDVGSVAKYDEQLSYCRRMASIGARLRIDWRQLSVRVQLSATQTWTAYSPSPSDPQPAIWHSGLITLPRLLPLYSDELCPLVHWHQTSVTLLLFLLLPLLAYSCKLVPTNLCLRRMCAAVQVTEDWHQQEQQQQQQFWLSPSEILISARRQEFWLSLSLWLEGTRAAKYDYGNSSDCHCNEHPRQL